MGTRWIVHIVDVGETEEDQKTLLTTLYGQWDGYFDDAGMELYDIISPIKLRDGLPYNATNVANGMGCLAAQIISQLKKPPGSIYILEPDIENFEEFTYTIYNKSNEIYMKAEESGEEDIGQFDGPIVDFPDWLAWYNEGVEELNAD